MCLCASGREAPGRPLPVVPDVAPVACVLNGLTDEEITVKLLGGELHIKWDRKENLVYMTGPAKIVFEGEVDPYSI